MGSLKILTAPEQVAAHLRGELARGRWRRVMPGEDRMIAELGIGRHTIKAALKLLETEGWLENLGAGRQRRIVPQKASPVNLRIRILLYKSSDRNLPENLALMARLQETGFSADYAKNSQQGLGMNLGRIIRFVEKHPADAWVISAGSREVLEWFADRPVPAFAMLGSFSGIPIAGACPRKTPAMQEAVRRLVDYGHRRIVMLTREDRRKPRPALFEQNFLDELARHGIATSAYHLPDWKEDAEGLHTCLEMLFGHTPPTAIIFADPDFYHAVHHFLARRRMAVPEDISLVYNDPDPGFAWCRPQVVHFRWGFSHLIRRVLRWADNIDRGKEDKRQTLFDAEYVEGGTIGPARKDRR